MISSQKLQPLDHEPGRDPDIIIIYLLTAIGLTPGGNSTAHIYTQTLHRKHRTEHTQ
jgi:hypothetical protein